MDLGISKKTALVIASSKQPAHGLTSAFRPRLPGNTVIFLCSDKASFITGSSIPVDGGAIRGY
jgi:NAD(P)-dependent dehydrogenase (short-subunit alcohol dehydrogenase family)